MGWVVLTIVIVVAVISAVSQVLKGQKEAAAPPPRRARPRPAQGGAGVRSSSGDIDRFLQEIDRLRKRPAEAAEPGRSKGRPTATPVRSAGVPVVEPVRARRLDPPPVAPRLEDLPVAAVVPPPPARPALPPPTPAAPTIAALGKVATATARKGPQTPFGKDLVAMFSGSRQAIATAVILQEVLGPPKCKGG